jgi:flagellar basal body-associated protein FliL
MSKSRVLVLLAVLAVLIVASIAVYAAYASNDSSLCSGGPVPHGPGQTVDPTTPSCANPR